MLRPEQFFFLVEISPGQGRRTSSERSSRRADGSGDHRGKTFCKSRGMWKYQPRVNWEIILGEGEIEGGPVGEKAPENGSVTPWTPPCMSGVK